MATTTSRADTAAGPLTAAGRSTRLLAILVIATGLIMAIAGLTTWMVVQSQLADERITVSEDAARYAGDRVDGPLTAYEQAAVIEKHALESSDGKTYAELDREDPTRATVMNASFLRASLFTSVVSFGVAAMAMLLGLVVILIGLALLNLARQFAGPPAAAGRHEAQVSPPPA
jgi:hypothetical protein